MRKLARTWRVLTNVLVLAMAWSVTPLKAMTSPATVSPGGTRDVIRVEARCPAFSWGAVTEAHGYELVVYRLPDSEEEAAGGELPEDEMGTWKTEVTLREQLPAGALSWTPSMERCLARGAHYAWLVRAAGVDGASEWSEPRLFEVAAGPSAADVEQALAVLQAYLLGGMAETGISTPSGTDLEEPAGGPSTGDLGAGSGPGRKAIPVADVTAILGQVPDPAGITFGLHGISASTDDGSAGVVGVSTASGGATAGVVGEVDSVAGVAGVFDNTAGGQILSGRNNTAEVFSVDGAGNVTTLGTIDGVDVGSHAGDTNAHHTVPTELPPTGAAGGHLAGNFPNPVVVDDSHAHTGATLADDWVNAAGDTMTGTLTLSPAVGEALHATGDINLEGGTILSHGELFIHANGTFNTSIGGRALANVTSGVKNTALGELALANNTDGNNNTASGTYALNFNQSGDDNTAIGFSALVLNTTGSKNTATGWNALRYNNGDNNTAVGHNTLRNNTSGINNTAIGRSALHDNTTGEFNTAIGSSALNRNVGSSNTAVGQGALNLNVSGSSNTAIGTAALVGSIGGHHNIAIGELAGKNLQGSESFNILIGHNSWSGESNTIRIGAGQSRTFIAGILNATSALSATAVLVDSFGQLVTFSCGTYKEAAVCPIGNVDGPTCDTVPVGSFCESDDECGTSNDLDNCGGRDWYFRLN